MFDKLKDKYKSLLDNISLGSSKNNIISPVVKKQKVDVSPKLSGMDKFWSNSKVADNLAGWQNVGKDIGSRIKNNQSVTDYLMPRNTSPVTKISNFAKEPTKSNYKFSLGDDVRSLKDIAQETARYSTKNLGKLTIDPLAKYGKAMGNLLTDTDADPMNDLRNIKTMVGEGIKPFAAYAGLMTGSGIKNLAGLTGLNTVFGAGSNALQGRSQPLLSAIKDTEQDMSSIIPKAGLYAGTNMLTDKILAGQGLDKIYNGKDLLKKAGILGASNLTEDIATSFGFGWDPDMDVKSGLSSFLLPSLFMLGDVKNILSNRPEKLLQDAVGNGKINVDKSGNYRIGSRWVTKDNALKYVRKVQEMMEKASKDGTLDQLSKNVKELDKPIQETYSQMRSRLGVSPYGEGTSSLMGAGLGFELERDDEGNITGVKYNPTKGAAGLAVSMGLTKDVGRDQVENILKGTDVKTKANLIDYFRTPEEVLKKIGLGDEAELLKQKHNDYLDQLPKELDKVTQWWERVGRSDDASRRIFKALDGQQPIEALPDNEREVAKEIQNYLSDWADKLGLPEDKRIASYITHIFEPDFIEKEFDPELAKIITDKVPGSVYDPFLQERLGAKGYVEDTFRALDAYVKRATRKYNMDQALEPLKEASKDLDLESWNYVKRLGDRINMRPTEIDNLLDNLIKSIPGIGYKFGQRPTARITNKLRQMTYRGALGLNVGSAIKNLTQGVNTYAELGEKYTGVGYVKAIRDLFSKTGELEEVGVLRDSFIQDRNLSATKKTLQQIDDSLWVMFDMAEKINRGAAYYGAKAKSLDAGKSMKEAINDGIEAARKTQFTFGSVDTPVALQGDIVKFITQFQSYNVKQLEFLLNKVKEKDIAGLVRWAGATFLLTQAVGGLINYDFSDAIPFSGAVTGEGTKIGNTPPIQLAKGVGSAVLNLPDKYGNVSDDPLPQRLADNRDIRSSLAAFIPAGVQAKKTIQGVGSYLKGYSETPSGRVRYPITKNTSNAIRTGLLGQYAIPEAREYFDNERTPLGEQQSAQYKQLQGDERSSFFKGVLDKREKSRKISKVKEQVRREAVSGNSTGTGRVVDGDFIFYNQREGEVQTIQLEWGNPPTDELERYRWEKDRLSEARKIPRSSGLSEIQKRELASAMGYDYQEIERDAIAKSDVKERSIWIKQKLGSMSDVQEAKRFLFQLAVLETLSGDKVLTSSVAEEMGPGMEQLYDYFTDIYKRSSYYGKPRKPRKPTYRKVSAPSLPSTSTPKVKSPTLRRTKTYRLSDL